jgi:hypothetical protein
MTKRKKKRKTGKGVLIAFALALLWLAPALVSGDKRVPSAVIAGTVFRDTGLSLRGAQIIVAGLEKDKKREWKTLSDPRGEFFLRVPAGPADYNVIVRASGYRLYQKQVKFAGDERVELSVILEPESGTR